MCHLNNNNKNILLNGKHKVTAAQENLDWPNTSVNRKGIPVITAKVFQLKKMLH
jgi:hypothetical protein